MPIRLIQVDAFTDKPFAGIDEDPVTGSAHCCLAPFWSPRLGKLAMIGFQAAPAERSCRPTALLNGASHGGP